jgi:predicted transcriptional regulator
MARKKTPHLTEAELRLMNIVWELGSATVGQIVDTLPTNPPVAYSTVLTLMRILETKGYVRHTKDGRAFVYRPVVGSKEASTKAIRHLLTRFFGGSAGQLVLKLLDERQLDPDELKHIKQKINESERSS